MSDHKRKIRKYLVPGVEYKEGSNNNNNKPWSVFVASGINILPINCSFQMHLSYTKTHISTFDYLYVKL
ncbi:MAG: hypothetical protein ACJ702_04465 [Nitrososphaeraceae archaeon]